MKIKALTAEQGAELFRFRQHHFLQRYLDIACNGGRIERDKLEVALTDAYAVLGIPAPRLFIFDSPAACMIATKILEKKMDGEFRLGSNIRNQLTTKIRGPLGAELWRRLWDWLLSSSRDALGRETLEQRWEELREQLWEPLEHQLKDQHFSRLRQELSVRVGRQLPQQLWDRLPDQLGVHLGEKFEWQNECLREQRIWNPNFLWGTMDLHWVIRGKFVECNGAELPFETAHHLDVMERINCQCEWWWPFENAVIASQRPISVTWGHNQCLHCEDGPAVRYADGYSLFSDR